MAYASRQPFSLRHFRTIRVRVWVVVTNHRRVDRFRLDSLHKSVGRRPLVRGRPGIAPQRVFATTLTGAVERPAARSAPVRGVDTTAYRGSTSRRVASWIPPLLKITCPLGRLMSIRKVAVHSGVTGFSSRFILTLYDPRKLPSRL